MHGSDPMRPEKGTWWEIPGGGIEPGETSQEAASRELYEECGFRDVEVGPCIWTQYVEFDFAMYHFKTGEIIDKLIKGDYSPNANVVNLTS